MDAGLKTSHYLDYNNQASVIPDYNDPQFIEAIEKFYAALGQQYDGDPRIATIQSGIVGFWGEWHTYPYNGANGQVNYMPSPENQLRYLRAFDNAFDETPIQTRYPAPFTTNLDMGYHDDSFAYATDSSVDWHYMNVVNNNAEQDKWMTNLIAGELYPPIQSDIFSDRGALDSRGMPVDFLRDVQSTHISWMMAEQLFNPSRMSDSVVKDRAIAAAQNLGYTYYVSERNIADTDSNELPVEIKIENLGVAPFYVDWPVTISLQDADTGVIVKEFATNWSIKGIQPNTPQTYQTQLDVADLPKADYNILLTVNNPLSTGIPFRFANRSQDQDRMGSVTLATVTINPSIPTTTISTATTTNVSSTSVVTQATTSTSQEPATSLATTSLGLNSQTSLEPATVVTETSTITSQELATSLTTASLGSSSQTSLEPATGVTETTTSTTTSLVTTSLVSSSQTSLEPATVVTETSTSTSQEPAIVVTQSITTLGIENSAITTTEASPVADGSDTSSLVVSTIGLVGYEADDIGADPVPAIPPATDTAVGTPSDTQGVIDLFGISDSVTVGNTGLDETAFNELGANSDLVAPFIVDSSDYMAEEPVLAILPQTGQNTKFYHFLHLLRKLRSQ